jgi:hypothetical protein
MLVPTIQRPIGPIGQYVDRPLSGPDRSIPNGKWRLHTVSTALIVSRLVSAQAAKKKERTISPKWHQHCYNRLLLTHWLQTQVPQDLRRQRLERPALYENSNNTILQGERQRNIKFIGTQIP